MPILNVTMQLDEATANEARRLIADAQNAVYRADIQSRNKAAMAGMRLAKKALSTNLGIKQKEFITPHRFGAKGSESTGKAIRVDKATPAKPDAVLWCVGNKRIQLEWFSARQVAGKTVRYSRRRRIKGGRVITENVKVKTRSGGVKYKIGQQGWKTLKQAFIARTKTRNKQTGDLVGTGGTAVFFRLGAAKRLPLHVPVGPSIGSAAEKDSALRSALDINLSDIYIREMKAKLAKIAQRVDSINSEPLSPPNSEGEANA